MTLELKTFAIRDGAAEDDEVRLAHFLRSIEVDRIDTAYSEGAWRVLVHFRDLRRKEERAQIESAILQAISSWRADVARNTGVEKEQVLSTTLLAEIARYAPTTETELSVILNAVGAHVGHYGGDIVRVVRQTMEELTDF